MSGARGAIITDEMRQTARDLAPDRYYAALLAPRDVRDDLVTLAAFAGEMVRIEHLAREPMIGEIRLQWWRDALAAERSERTGNPLADQLRETVRRHGLSAQELDPYFDQVTDVVVRRQPDDDAQFMLGLDRGEGIVFRLAFAILGGVSGGSGRGESAEAASRAITAAARAYGLARTGIGLPADLARGYNPLPPSRSPSPYLEAPDWRDEIRSIVEDARQQLAELRSLEPFSSALTTALLPVALVEPYLEALQNSSHRPARDIADILPVRRMWRLAKAHFSGRL